MEQYVTVFYVRKVGEDRWSSPRPAAHNAILRNAKARVKRWIDGKKDGESRKAIVREFGEEGELVHESVIYDEQDTGWDVPVWVTGP